MRSLCRQLMIFSDHSTDHSVDNSTDSGTEHCWAFTQKKGKKEN